MRSVWIVLLCCGALFTGCAPKVYPVQTPFDADEFAAYEQAGTSTLYGQAFLKTRGGEVRYAAGNTVSLIPATAYSREIQRYTIAGLRVSPDPRWRRSLRSVVADGSGHFQFDNLPAGAYLLECPIFWEVPGYYGPLQTGGVVRMEVTVLEGQTHNVIATY